MLSKAEFIDFILNGGGTEPAAAPQPMPESALPDGFDGFETAAIQTTPVQPGSSFARRLLEASGLGNPEFVQRSSLIRSSDAVARYLPERVSFWPKTPSRPYQTLLFEADLNHKNLLAIPAFKSRNMAHLDIVEDALARLVSEALEGFQRGGEGVTADVRKGSKEETLCVVSILDERDGQPVRLVCFGTQNKSTIGLETFQITEQTRSWDPQLAREHLGLLYERQFKKLQGQDWQEAFTTTDERKLADKLLNVCTRESPTEHDIQEGVLDLLDTIAKGFGLKKKPQAERRLQAFKLPADHDIGIDPEDRESSFGGKNPFSGVTLRDERSRLLGYIVYPLKNKSDATRLRKHLETNNRFHNVLVVYPDQDQASLELWQGREQLIGKLRKGQGYRDAADVVNLLSRFFVVSKAKVRNPTELAQELAYRARYLRRLAVKQLEDETEKGPLRDLYNAFKAALVHDLSGDKFADAYAQTITYGLLTARWTGNAQLIANNERLTRQTALKLMPASSPFLKEFFKSVLAVQLDEQQGRLLWLVEDIADLLDRVDVEYVFGAGDPESTSARDPVIHFYEPFLNAYDATLKKELGVFYTPLPVVSYIVRSVHELLQTEFDLADGLADITTWGEMLKRRPDLKLPLLTDEPGETRTISPDESFVQILDPATGTATFLVETIEVIHRTLTKRWNLQQLSEGEQLVAWNDYVPQHLLPRIHAFELMMAPYAIAHMKISLKLAETGYRFGNEERARIYLTNTLEPWVKQPPLIGFDALAHEAATVNEIKRHKRFTVVIGNPPYSVLSANLTDTARRIVDNYRYINGQKIQERSMLRLEMHLQDDYIKFLAFIQRVLHKARAGVIGVITNYGYLDNLTLRGVRFALCEQFQNLAILNLHGSRQRRSRATESIDENIFDIEQGIAITTGVELGINASSSRVRYAELLGSREVKNSVLLEQTAASIEMQLISTRSPNYLLTPRDDSEHPEYESYASITDVMPANISGIVTAHDYLVVDFDETRLKANARILRDNEISDDNARELLKVTDNAGWKLAKARRNFRNAAADESYLKPYSYRPFDVRTIYYQQDLVFCDRRKLMSHTIAGRNLALATCRQLASDPWEHIFVTRHLQDDCLVSNRTRERSYHFPLYLYEDVLQFDAGQVHEQARRPNLSPAFLISLAGALKQEQIGQLGLPAGLSPEDIFHYAYTVFHSPGYRSRYAEFLKIDFPRLPLIGNLELFRTLARLGGELTALHLLESPKLAHPITEFTGSPNPEVEKPVWFKETVWVDKRQTTGFKGVPEDVWNFHIGGYQVCHKWLKDRKGRILSDEDIAHYHKIVVALSETIRLMREIDEVIDQHGGWPGAFVTTKSGNSD